MTGRQKESTVSAAAVAQADPLRRPGFHAKDVVLLANCPEDAGLCPRPRPARPGDMGGRGDGGAVRDAGRASRRGAAGTAQ
ncbi:hypothetical protein [Streptomyces sp. NPDC056628]|uniref:hypothetical protein n=1 Tax=Streptomyces sp. NPDC056628 TaxID=3345882 RepID=UPI0036B981E1